MSNDQTRQKRATSMSRTKTPKQNLRPFFAKYGCEQCKAPDTCRETVAEPPPPPHPPAQEGWPAAVADGCNHIKLLPDPHCRRDGLAPSCALEQEARRRPPMTPHVAILDQHVEARKCGRAEPHAPCIGIAAQWLNYLSTDIGCGF